MKIKPSTLGLVFVALLLGGIALIVMQQPAPKSPESGEQVSGEEQPLFEFDAADIASFTLKTRLRTMQFERDRADQWQMTEPEKATASDPSISFLLDLMTSGKGQTMIAPTSDREQFGLHQPLATIDLTLKDETTHKLVVGDYNFNRGHLYAQVDPPDQAAQMKLFLVSPSFDNAVNRPLNEWKQAAGAEKSTKPGAPDPSAAESPIAPPPSESVDSPQEEPQPSSESENSENSSPAE